MRTMIITAILLSALVAGIICNTIYTVRTANTLLEMIGEISDDVNSPDNSTQIAEIREMIRANEAIFAISVSMKEVEGICETATKMYIAQKHADKVSYLIAKSALIAGITKLKRSEILSWESVV